MGYSLSRRAEEDLIEAYVYGVARFGVGQAERYIAGLTATFALIAAHPLIAREWPEFEPPVRLHFHAAHVIAYTIEDDGVTILRVLDGRQDWERVL
ncbi:type II toxin-antitoxin system RelE/ParE family toxin [Prosthecomicrobium pneumaticum]|uniref:Toxin n=1 Tax=Prosthecomicrobium pneumaticum TaxID=81895 RepID=A0A7W9FPK6_9HYPH|nr:type II toxin-antitoxin system RelE/ParE family toxin [Prosthecomicrobium pneumaticum]MBB5754457.1 toxin ParE1/3/4 [Prosthecomicrobium pneumaticum]